MKKYLLVLLIISGQIGLPGISAQEFLKNMDSVKLIRPKKSKASYEFSDNGTKEIRISASSKTEWIEYRSKGDGWKEFRRDLFTAISGIGISSEDDGYFRISRKISCTDSLPDWHVIIFCEGTVQTDRERVRDSDGSWTTETSETNVYFWDKNANGILVEGKDTIGEFLISINPLQDERFLVLPAEFRPLPEAEKQESPTKRKVFVSWVPEPARDFGIIGNFREIKFAMVQIGFDRKVWIFKEETLYGLFQSETMNPGQAKKKSLLPLLLINKYMSPDERKDLFRLAMVSKVLNGTIGN